MGTGGYFPYGKSGHSEMLTAHLHQVPNLLIVRLYLHSSIRLMASLLIKQKKNLTFFTSLFVTLSVQSSHEGLVDGTCNI
jgi:hypothetical protein